MNVTTISKESKNCSSIAFLSSSFNVTTPASFCRFERYEYRVTIAGITYPIVSQSELVILVISSNGWRTRITFSTILHYIAVRVGISLSAAYAVTACRCS